MHRAFRLYNRILVLPFIAAVLGCLALIVWDPLDIRPWGRAPDLSQLPYPLPIRPMLAPAMTRREQSVVLAGSSTAIPLQNAQLARLGDGRQAANVSQAAQRVPDSTVAFIEAARTPGLDRLVLEVSHIWLHGDEGLDPHHRRYMAAYDPAWFDMPDFDRDVIRAGLADANGGQFFTPDWEKARRKIVPDGPVGLSSLQRRNIAQVLEIASPSDFPAGVTARTCANAPGLADALRRTFAIARQRKMRVDIYFSPIPYAAWPMLSLQQHRAFIAYPRPFFNEVMKMHRCVVDLAAAEQSPLIVTHAISADPQVVGDMVGMKDALHFIIPQKFDRVVDDLGTGRFRLTPAGFDAYRETVRQGILAAIARGDADFGPLPPPEPPIETKP